MHAYIGTGLQQPKKLAPTSNLKLYSALSKLLLFIYSNQFSSQYQYKADSADQL